MTQEMNQGHKRLVVPSLPAPFFSCSPTLEDLARVTELMILSGNELNYTAEDTLSYWQSSGCVLETDAWLVKAPENQVVGYALLLQTEREGSAEFGLSACVHSAASGQGIGTFLLRQAEERVRQMVQASGGVQHYTLINEINGNNLLAQRLLEQEDYQFLSRSLTMEITLESSPFLPGWSESMAVRSFVPGQDDQVMYELMTETFEEDRVRSFEEWQHEFQQRTDFDPSLWWLATQGEKVIGGIFSYISPEHGWIDHLGVRRSWRRQGVGFALLQQTFATLYHHGVRRVALATASDNRTGAAHLYERAGMQVVGAIDVYQKQGVLEN